MNIEQRIRICRLLEKMEQQADYSKKLGLANVSSFYGVRRSEKEEEQKNSRR